MLPLIDIFLTPHVFPDTNTVRIDIVAIGDEPQRLVALDLGFSWDPSCLVLQGSSQEVATVNSIVAGLPCPVDTCSYDDFYLLNEASPPADGDGYFVWLGMLGEVIETDKAILGSLWFTMTGDWDVTNVDIITTVEKKGSNAPFHTALWGTNVPGLEIQDALIGCKLVRPVRPMAD